MTTEERLEEIRAETCLRLLGRHRFGRVAVTDDEGPLILPVNYALVDRTIVFRTEPGTKLLAAREGDAASFEIDDVDVERRIGWSVLARGPLSEVVDEDERASLTAALTEPFPGGVRPHLLRIGITSVSGRRIPLPTRVPDDWFDKPDLGNIWYGPDGTDLLG